jgi:tetratricopeptide (TPR) repeat protein
LAQSAWAATGGQPGNVFNFGANARALGMGGAYSALTQDDSSVYYNPAGLGTLGDRRLSFMDAALYEGVNYNYLGYAQPLLAGGLGINLLRVGSSGIDGRDSFNRQTGSFNYSETGIALGYGYWGLFDGRMSAGFTGKMLQRSIGSVSNRLVGFDAGVRYAPMAAWGQRLQFSGVAQNLVGTAMGNTSDRLPVAFKLGAAWEFMPAFHLAGDVSSSGELSLGTEYGWRFAAFRVGVQRQGMSFGTGLFLANGFQLDYAVYNDSTLGMSNRVSVGWKLPGARGPERAKERGKDALREGLQALHDRRYVAAAHLLERAVKLDAELAAGPDSLLARRLREFVTGLELQEQPKRQEDLVVESRANDLAGKAVALYLEGNDPHALLFAEAALGTNTQEEVLRPLLNFMEGRAGHKAPREDILPLQDLIAHKDNKALDAFYAMHFEAARQEWEDEVVLDPDNVLAWTRLGSAAFATGALETAKRAYSRALQLVPKNKEVAVFMAEQGWK